MRCRPYLYAFGITIGKGAVYRANFFVQLLTLVLPLVVYYVLWTAAYRGVDELAGYTFPSMITYYIVARWLGSVVIWETDWGVWSDIRDGGLSPYLLKPISYLGYKLVSEAGYRVPGTIISFVMIGGFALIISDSVVLPSSLVIWVAFLASAVLAYLLSQFLSLLRAVLAFWFSETGWISYIDWLVLSLFAGMIVPLELLPAQLRAVAYLLPFRGLIHLPAQIFTGNATMVIEQLCIQIVWTVAAGCCLLLLWRAGLRRYQAAGG